MLSVRNLKVQFSAARETVYAVNGVSYEMKEGETLGVVGESGSGKSTTCLSLLGLLPREAAVSGEAIFEGRDLLKLPENELRMVRGQKIAMVFQEPMSSLNPVLRIATQIAEVTKAHLGHSSKQARAHAVKMLELVGIPDAPRVADAYLHQLSGGMRQRVMVALALSCRPRLLIADEPTSSLDVTIQAQILDLIRRLRDETGTAVLLVSHDLEVIAGMADYVCVMYRGRIVEAAPKSELFRHPQNPYTRALLNSIPDPARRDFPLYEIGGQLPSASYLENMRCPFVDRCVEAQESCSAEFPPFRSVGADHWSLCHFSPDRGPE